MRRGNQLFVIHDGLSPTSVRASGLPPKVSLQKHPIFSCGILERSVLPAVVEHAGRFDRASAGASLCRFPVAWLSKVFGQETHRIKFLIAWPFDSPKTGLGAEPGPRASRSLGSSGRRIAVDFRERRGTTASKARSRVGCSAARRATRKSIGRQEPNIPKMAASPQQRRDALR